jgi:AcrR family transcriptional regulator
MRADALRKEEKILPSFTKKAILESFLRLAEKKPIDKITVRDIVDDCGVNRNTFYYYFQDIYAVLEDLCRSVVNRIPAELSLPATMRVFLETIAGFAAKYPHAAKSLSLSLGFEGLERYFATDLDGLVMDCAVRERKSVPSQIEIAMLRHAILGLCLDVLKDGKHPPYTAQQLELALRQEGDIRTRF